MAKRTAKGKDKGRISEDEVVGIDKVLIEHGKSYPHVPGLIRSLVPLCPPAIRVLLKYNYRVAWSSSTGALSLQVFTGNGLFDPDITNAGAQPLGYDQWSAFYNRYRVLASSMQADYVTPDASTNDAQTLRVALVPSASATTYTNFEAAASQPYAVSKYVNGTIPNNASRLTALMESAVINGRTKQGILDDDNMSAATSANPADLWYWHLYCSPVDSTATTSGSIIGTVSYLVDFFDRSLLSLSAQLERKRTLEKRTSKGKF